MGIDADIISNRTVGKQEKAISGVFYLIRSENGIP